MGDGADSSNRGWLRRALRFNPKGRLKDRQRRALLDRAGIAVEVELPTFAAGARSGVWTVVEQGLGPDSVVYSFGVGDNLAWELAMIDRFGLQLQAFDPTPRAGNWLRTQSLPPGLRFHPVGLADRDGEQLFAAPRNSRSVNYRPLGDASVRGDGVTCPVRRLGTLRRELGDERIDILKMDIEGGEYAVIDDIVAEAPGQLLVEFHHRADGASFDRTRAAIDKLHSAGYRIHWISRRGLEFGFVRL